MMKKIFLNGSVLFCAILTWSPIAAADSLKPLAIPNNFNGIVAPYYSDGKNVFYHLCDSDKPECYILIPGADPSTFSIVQKEYAGLFIFGKDKGRVYFGSSPIPLADPETFMAIEAGFGKDRRRVYYGNRLLRGVNARSFKLLDIQYGTDGRRVVYLNTIVRGADGQSFQVDSSSWAHDKLNVYSEGKKIANLDPNTFTTFNHLIVKDAQKVFCLQKELHDVDAATFVALNDIYAKDKSNAYVLTYNNKKMRCEAKVLTGANVSKFQLFQQNKWTYKNIATDGKFIYSNGTIVQGETVDNFDAEDWYQKLKGSKGKYQ